MPLLQVRNCPEDLYERISRYAKQQNRTIAQQTLVILEKGMGQEQPNMERRRKLLAKISARRIPNDVNNIDDIELIREDRNR